MPGSGKKKKKRSGSQALGAEDTGSAKESEETSFGDNDEEDLMSPKVFLNDKINVFQQKYPRTFREISTMFNDEDSIMVMISTYEDYEDKDEFDELLPLNVDIVRNMIANGRFSKAAFQQVYRALPSAEKSGHAKGAGVDTKEIAIVDENISRPTKAAIRKKFEDSKGKNLLLNRWTPVHTQIFEGIVKDALDGTGMDAGEVLYLNVDGSCLLHGIVPVQGDSIASSAVHQGGGGRFFGTLKFAEKPSDNVVGSMPLLITDLSHRVLQYPYHLDTKNPLTLPEFSALNFFNEIFAGCLSMNDSVLTRDYMTMAAKFAIAQDCVLGIMRMICQIIYDLDNQATWANILACQSLSGSNLRDSPNVYGYMTPTMLAARSKYPGLERGTLAIGRVMEGFRSEQGKEQMQALLDLYAFEYDGQGASQFAIQMQQLCLNAQSSVPGLPQPEFEEREFHPGTSDTCGIQLYVIKLDECLQEHPTDFRASEFAALQELKKLHASRKLPTFNAVLTWSKNMEAKGDLRPSPNRLKGRASGFLSQTPPEESSHPHSVSPEEYTDAIACVAAQLTQDEFATYFDRISSAALGYEYRLKLSTVPEKTGNTKVVYVDADLDSRGKAMVTKLRMALLFHWNGKPNPKYNGTVAQAKKVQFKHHPACKLNKSQPSDTKRPPKSGPHDSDSESRPALDSAKLSKGQKYRANKAAAQAKLAQVEDEADAATLKLFRELHQKAKGAATSKKDAKKASTPADQAPAIAAAVAQGNSAFVARLASLEKSLAELQASSSGSAMSATQVSGSTRKSTDEILVDIQSTLSAQQAQLRQLTKEQPSMFSGFHFDEPGVDGSK